MACYEMKKLIYLTGKPAPVLKFIVTLSISAKTKKNCIKRVTCLHLKRTNYVLYPRVLYEKRSN